jgi:double-strand break repair protein MRE11
VRPFVLEELVLSEIAEEEGFELMDRIAISKVLKARVGALISVLTFVGSCTDRASK